MAENWRVASPRLFIGIVHFLEILCKIINISFIADSSFGKD